MQRKRYLKWKEKQGMSYPYCWHEITDDVKRDMLVLGRQVYTQDEAMALDSCDTLWPIGTIVQDDDGTIYEWR